MQQYHWRAGPVCRVPDSSAVVVHVALIVCGRQGRGTMRFEIPQVVVIRFNIDLTRRMSSLSKLASECQHRYLFNQFFSNAIHLPYVPNSYRAPFQSWLMERGGVVLNHLAIAEHIDKEYRNLIAERLKIGPTNLSLPFFLTAVLSRISKICDFGTALADLRLRARPLRQRLAELDDAILQRPKLLRLKGYVTPLKERSLH